jgi:hypothetical protein
LVSLGITVTYPLQIARDYYSLHSFEFNPKRNEKLKEVYGKNEMVKMLYHVFPAALNL